MMVKSQLMPWLLAAALWVFPPTRSAGASSHKPNRVRGEYHVSALNLKATNHLTITSKQDPDNSGRIIDDLCQNLTQENQNLSVIPVEAEDGWRVVVSGLRDPKEAESIRAELRGLGLREVNLESGLYTPNLDGYVDEPEWQAAEVAAGFTQTDPEEGLPATEDTEIRVLYDNERIYFGIVCYDRDPDGIIATEMRRDERLDSNDNVEILLDTYHDRRNAFYFQINPLGTRRDAQITDEGKNVNDDWDCVWQVEANTTARGWEAEIAIPLDQLRFADSKTEAAGQTWGVNFARTIRRKNEQTYWVPVPRDFGYRGFYRVSNSGTIYGLDGIRSSLRLEVKPYNLSGVERDFAEVPVLRDNVFTGGLDVKWGITANLTADLTYNTDFAQVEADQRQVNLTRFSLFFPEKRDFFLENAGIFRVGEAGGPGGAPPPEQLFYSRRIGLFKRRQVPIIGGARVTGRVGAFNVGFLNVYTDDFSFVDEGELYSTPEVNFSVLRLKRYIMQRSSIGLIALSRDERTGENRNRTFGVDGTFAFGSSSLVTWLAHSDSRGAETDTGRNWAGTPQLHLSHRSHHDKGKLHRHSRTFQR